LQGPKTIFFLQGPKLKRGIFAGTSAIFKPSFSFVVPLSYFMLLAANKDWTTDVEIMLTLAAEVKD